MEGNETQCGCRGCRDGLGCSVASLGKAVAVAKETAKKATPGTKGTGNWRCDRGNTVGNSFDRCMNGNSCLSAPKAWKEHDGTIPLSEALALKVSGEPVEWQAIDGGPWREFTDELTWSLRDLRTARFRLSPPSRLKALARQHNATQPARGYADAQDNFEHFGAAVTRDIVAWLRDKAGGSGYLDHDRAVAAELERAYLGSK